MSGLLRPTTLALLLPATLSTILGTPCSVQAQVSKIEKKIVTAVDDFTTDNLKLWEESVNTNSGSMNFEGVYKVGQLYKPKLEALGFTTRWVDGKAFGRAGHLVAEHVGSQSGKKILLIGHLDTVFEPDSPFQKFSMINDSTAQGPGAGDMKGGNVIMIQSLQALAKAGLLKDMNIVVVMSGDEESSGRPLALARHDLIEAAKWADVAIGFEDGDGLFEHANISRRSASHWELRVTGVPAHSSQVFTKDIGAGAIYEASRILYQFYDALSTEQDLTFNPGVILGGTAVEYDDNISGGKATGKDNIVSRDVVVTGDIRAISPEQLKKAQDAMSAIVSKHLPQTQAEIFFGEGYPPLAPTEGNKQLLAYFNQVSKDFGFGEVSAVKPRDAGAADISFTSGYVDMALDGVGMRTTGGHTVNEKADPHSISKEAKRVAILLYRLTAKKVQVK
ncbi:MAG TPA: M20/M25/M40 family metallo-hydrolase [Chryseolinea sp.]|nr:M20/M25/M40 family metallo-hydrolase [Chryseolinea sp.]